MDPRISTEDTVDPVSRVQAPFPPAATHLLQTLLGAIPDMAWLRSADGTYLACNARFADYFGLLPSDIIGMGDADFMTTEQAVLFSRTACGTGKAALPPDERAWMRLDDCKTGLSLEIACAPVAVSPDTPDCRLGIARDVTTQRHLEKELNGNIRKFEYIFESVGDCIELISMDGRILDMNRAGYERLGYPRSEMVGHALSEFSAPEYAARIPERMRLIRDRGQATFESARRHKNGTVVPTEVSSRIVNLDGESVFLSISRDITRRKLVEEERDRLSSALIQSDEAASIVDAEGRYLYVNPAFCRLFGYTQEELTGQHIRMLMPSEDVSGPSSHQTLSTALQQGSFQGEVRRRAKDGAIIPILLKVSPLRDEHGNLSSYIGTMTDLTEIKRMENVLRASEQHFQSIIENAPLGMVTITLDGRFIQVNQAFCDIVGYSRETLTNLSFKSISHPDDVGISLNNIEKLMKGEIMSYRIEKRYFHKDGHVVWAQVDTSLQREPSGKPQHLICQIRDITAQKQAEETLRESEEKLRRLYELSPLGIALTDMNGRYIEFNESFSRICGYAEEELKRLDYWTLTPRRFEAEETRQLELLSRTGRYGPYEKEYRRKDGTLVPLRLNGVRMEGPGGEDYIWSIVEDITESKKAEENLHIIASVFENSQEAIVITDPDNRITDVNPAFSRITGYTRAEVLGKNPGILSSGRHDRAFYEAMWNDLQQDKAWRGEIWNRHKNGKLYAELLSISAICDRDGKIQRHVGIFSDISHFKEHEAELHRIAHYDALTGIPNRVLLADRMRQAIAQTAREQNLMAICYLDLDSFKPINDSMGHEAGDHVLIEVARRIANTIRGGDTVARLGGDEFVVLLLGLEKTEECATTLERLLAAISQPILVKNKHVNLNASIGVSLYPLDNEDPDTLLRHADQAMYSAKQAGKNRFSIYDPALSQRTRSRHELLRSVRESLKNGQFELYYQPKVAMGSERLVGAEALIRWHHPERGLLSPAEFLPAIENTELDIEIGDWVIADALRQLECWHREGMNIEVSINISAGHLESPGFAEKLQLMMARYPDLPAGALQIEMLESAALQDIAGVHMILEACHALGVRFALDDFGTGYSSLSYLSTLPVDVLKIDQSFVRDMMQDKRDMAIVHGIIALAKAFGQETVAEGIETREHYQALLDMGCEVGQGYGIARPMPAGELSRWTASQMPPAAPPRTSGS